MFVGILYLVSTPIGNLEDITIRAARILFSVDLILCEDTRRTGRLLEWLHSSHHFPNLQDKARPGLSSYTDYSRNRRMDEILARLAKDQNIALVSNAGTPLLSDPGFKLVQEVIEIAEEFPVKVEALPGANAVLPALLLSGLPPDKFLFLGFLPRKSGKRRHVLESYWELIAEDNLTVICFESPNRLLDTLADVGSVFGDVQIAVCRELTKMHEKILRGSLSTVSEQLSEGNLKGEITLLFNPGTIL